VVYEQAREGNLTACNMVLRWSGVYPDSVNAIRFDEGRAADFAIEDLVQRALDQGFVSAPKPLNVIDGAGIIEVK